MSFRFHLVSLVAMFLALALGIGMGATVIDKATVESLKRRVAAVEQSNTAITQKADALRMQGERDAALQSRLQEYATTNALKDVSLVVLAVRGVDSAALDESEKALAASGARITGTLWVTPKSGLVDEQATSALRTAFGSSVADVSQLRQLLVNRIASVMSGSLPGSALQPLLAERFLEWEGQANSSSAEVPFFDSRIAFVTSTAAQIPTENFALPFVRALAVQPIKRVVVGEFGHDADPVRNTPASRAVFVDLLRNDSATKNTVSTIDDLELQQGRLALVLALANIAHDRVGHYGVANTAEGPIPKVRP